MLKKTQAINCNCISKPDWPLFIHCQITNIIYKAKLHHIFETIMEKYATEPAKVHLNCDMETIRNHSIMENTGQIQNFRRNTFILDTILYFKKMPTNKKSRHLLFMF